MKDLKQKIVAVLFFLPFLVHVTIFVLYPAYNTVILSFKEDYSLLSRNYSGFGLENYVDIFKDKYFLQSITNTVLYTIITVPITIFLALLIASLLNQKLKFAGVFQTAFFLPMVTASTAVSYAWRLIFNSQYGVANSFIKIFGITPKPWLTASEYSLIVLIICGVWNMLPFSILTILSTLQGINEKYYQAASIDGASGFRMFNKITLPAIAPSVLLLGILNTISAFRVFDELFTLFSGKPGPNYNMYTLVYYMYEQMQTFSVGSYGRAAASAMILFFVLLCLSIIAFLLRISGDAIKRGVYEKR